MVDQSAYQAEDVLAEVISFFSAPMLGVMSMCSKRTLVVSDAHWLIQLKEIGKLPALVHSPLSAHRTVWLSKLRNLTGADARIEYCRCANGLSDAVRTVSPCPPTAEQVLQFVARVRSHHSWYKHLPIEKGTIFQMGLSPTAGMRCTPDGYIDYVKGDGTEFHYTWTPTKTYRERFNCFVWRRLEHSDDTTACMWTSDTIDMEPLLMPNLSSSTVHVTACVYGDTTHYGLLQSAYDTYKVLRAAGSEDIDGTSIMASLSTRRCTGQGLPAEVLTDFQRMYAFECKHPRETWSSSSEVLHQDAEEMCNALFPLYTKDDVRLEARMLLSSAHARFSTGPSGSIVRADGARAQVNMIRALLDWIRYIWGNDAVPDVTLSMPLGERKILERRLQDH